MLTMNNTMKNIDNSNWATDPDANNQKGVPSAIFIPHSNSLPFEERRVSLEQPVKIGRNVYRATPSPTNTIFECRVLSRHHATLYYYKGHFYLLDNKSSNGTFINNNRCVQSKEQEPDEVFSGDIVQFGISVSENTYEKQNTFPPVVALLKLYHPDGKEAKLSFNPAMTTPLHLKELYQLNNYVQEAMQREAALEGRLRTLKDCVERTRAEAQASWELFVGEQRLMMRVRTLENMLSAGKHPDEQSIVQLLDDKKKYQEVAQESLKMAHEQRLALEESLERRNREAAALQQNNCSLRLQASNALTELQKLATRCERKMCAARLAIAAALEREGSVRKHLPLAYSVQNGEAKMLVLCTDSNKLQQSKRNNGTLEDAIRALPDYIKLLLPQHLLNKVGIKAISADGKSAKEFDLILKKNEIYDPDNKDKIDTEKETAEETDNIDNLEEKTDDGDTVSDDEKQSRLNHDSHEESDSPVDGEVHADNNANSTYSDGAKDDSSNKLGTEYANILRVMAGLNEEIKALRERLSSSNVENEKLRTVCDELLAAQAEAKADSPAVEAEDAETFRTKIADLQSQLTRSTVAEESNMVEIQRLASNAADMQAELAFRPTRGDIDDLTAVIGKLQQQLQDKDQLLQGFKQTKEMTDKSITTSPSLEDLTQAGDLSKDIDANKISAKIDEMFQLDFDDDEDDDSESVATEINKDDSSMIVNEKDSSSVSDYVKLDDEERLQVTLQNGTLHALEEELVRAKERWAEVNEERAMLASQLATIQNKPALRFSVMHILAMCIPILVACIFYMLLPYIS